MRNPQEDPTSIERPTVKVVGPTNKDMGRYHFTILKENGNYVMYVEFAPTHLEVLERHNVPVPKKDEDIIGGGVIVKDEEGPRYTIHGGSDHYPLQDPEIIYLFTTELCKSLNISTDQLVAEVGPSGRNKFSVLSQHTGDS